MALSKVGVTQGTPAAMDDPTAKNRWPELWEYLTAVVYPGPERLPRQTATITLFSRPDGSLGATLNDRDNERSCFASHGTILGLLDSLEKVVGNEALVWRCDRQKTGSSKRKK